MKCWPSSVTKENPKPFAPRIRAISSVSVVGAFPSLAVPLQGGRRKKNQKTQSVRTGSNLRNSCLLNFGNNVQRHSQETKRFYLATNFVVGLFTIDKKIQTDVSIKTMPAQMINDELGGWID